MFRHAGLDDAHHVAFSAMFGELDDIKPYIAMGRKNRFPFDELFDVSNQEDDGSLIQVGSKRHHMALVSSHCTRLARGSALDVLSQACIGTDN